MKPDWIRKLAGMPARQLHLMGGGLLLVAAAALWSYALRAPLSALRAVRAEQATLEIAAGDPRLLAAQLAALDADTQALASRVSGAPEHDAARQAVGLLGEIGTLAQAHGVRLRGTAPVADQPVLSFTQAGFELDASGSYAALLAWIAAIEHSPAGLSVAGFDMHASDTPGLVDMKIRIAAYRPQETNR
jgi:type II secretory pathway component PulM